MKKSGILIALIFIASINVDAQATFKRHHGTTNVEFNFASDYVEWDDKIIFTGAGGSTTFGPYLYKYDNDPTIPNSFIIKALYSNPTVVNKVFYSVDAFTDQNGSKGYLAGGLIRSTITNRYEFLIVETDASGTPLKETHWGYQSLYLHSYINDIIKLPDGSFVAAGNTNFAPPIPFPSYQFSTIAYFNSSHNLVWVKSYGGKTATSESAISIVENQSNNSIIISGFSKTFSLGLNVNAYVQEFDINTGTLINENMFEVDSFHLFTKKIVAKTNYLGTTDGYTIVGKSIYTGYDTTKYSGGFIIHLDPNLQYKSHRLYDYNSPDSAIEFNSILYNETTDKYVIPGALIYQGNNLNQADGITIKIDPNTYNPLYGYVYEGSYSDHLRNVHLMKDKGYRFSGWFDNGNPSNNTNIFDLKTRPDLTVGCNEIPLNVKIRKVPLREYLPNFKDTIIVHSISHPVFSKRRFPIEYDQICSQNMRLKSAKTKIQNSESEQDDEMDPTSSEYVIYNMLGKEIGTYIDLNNEDDLYNLNGKFVGNGVQDITVSGVYLFRNKLDQSFKKVYIQK